MFYAFIFLFSVYLSLFTGLWFIYRKNITPDWLFDYTLRVTISSYSKDPENLPSRLTTVTQDSGVSRVGAGLTMQLYYVVDR